VKKRPAKKRSEWSTERLHSIIKQTCKRRYKAKITGREINKIWSDFVDEHINKGLEVGSIVNLKEFAKIWVKATPILEHKVAVSLLKRGKMFKDKMVVDANINLDSSDYIYKIMFEPLKYKGDIKVYFKPNASLKKAVYNGIKERKLITRFELT
jgi:hypothetical protein